MRNKSFARGGVGVVYFFAMKMEPQPLTFAPVYKSYLWGGERLPARYNRTDAPEVCAESWEISGHSDGMSVVDRGVYAGETLDALARRFGAQLIGRPLETFPLIFKLINAREQLSVQVHPSDATAAQWGGEAKSEMWYLLNNGHLCAGTRPGTTTALFQDALANHSVASLLIRHDVREGDALYIPGGLIHAICEGCLVYEVQQSSNTTYRLFDWERGRQLHIDEGLRVVDWQLAPSLVRASAGDRDVIRCDYFHMRERALDGAATVAMNDSFHVLFVKDGAVRVTAGGATVEAACGASVLLPACCGAYTLEGRADLLITTL